MYCTMYLFILQVLFVNPGLIQQFIDQQYDENEYGKLCCTVKFKKIGKRVELFAPYVLLLSDSSVLASAVHILKLERYRED